MREAFWPVSIALSVTHSKWLAEHARQKVGKTPLITFDSDFGPAERHLRKGYVGLDNLAFGQQLGMLIQRFRPQGGKVCSLIGSPQDVNHQERFQGIRQRAAARPRLEQRRERPGRFQPLPAILR